MADEENQPASKRAKLTIGEEEEDTLKPKAWRIYPPSSGKPRSYSIGEIVYFRPKSAKEDGKRGTVVEPLPTEEGRVSVKYANIDKPKSESCKRLVPVFGGPSILFTAETIPYRHLAASQVCDQDDVLEIGCSTGEASTILYRYGRSWVGFDSSTEMIGLCSEQLKQTAATKKLDKHWHACKMDALSDPTGALKAATKFSGPKGPSVAFMDIGGNREECGVIEIMNWVCKSFPRLRVFAIKSREIVKSLQQTTIDHTTGMLPNGSQWFQDKATEAQRRKTTLHPLQAPLVYSPRDATQPICRYQNYDPEGCKKGAKCPCDHDHCHLCLVKGHRAIHFAAEALSIIEHWYMQIGSLCLW